MKDHNNDSEKRHNSIGIQINNNRTRPVAQNTVIIGVVVFAIVLSTVVLLVRYHPLLLRGMRQSIDLEKLQHWLIRRLTPDLEKLQHWLIRRLTPDLINIKHGGIVAERQAVKWGFGDMAYSYWFSEDDILNDDNSLTNEKVPYQSPQDNIPNDDDDFEHEAGLYQYPQDNITNVTDRQQVIDDNIDDASHSSEVEVVTRDTSQTYVKVPYSSHGSSIDSAVRGDMPSRDEDNSNQQDRSFNPLLGDDRSCQDAVGGDIDDNDTASSINNDNDVNLLNYQPSSEHNSQPKKMVLGPLSLDLPVQNLGANLPHHLPHNHGGSSGEDDSGFQN